MNSFLRGFEKRGVSLFLSILLVFQLFPASLIETVYAAQDYSKVPISLAEGEVKDKATIEKLQKDPTLFANWGMSGSKNEDGFSGIPGVANEWQTKIMKSFLNKGITYGVENNGTKILIPINTG